MRNGSIEPKKDMLHDRPRVPLFIGSDIQSLTFHLTLNDKVDLQKYTDSRTYHHNQSDEDMNTTCPIQGCSTLNTDMCLWVCCGVITCCKCVIALFEFTSLAVCPWCGSLAVDMKCLTKMIVPVKNCSSCILSSASLLQVKNNIGIFLNAIVTKAMSG